MAQSIKLCIVAGARPNFMKIAPLIRALESHRELFAWSVVHTGQHYDREMSTVFFEELGIPSPNYNLECGGGTHAEQTARIMLAFERACLEIQPDLVIVVGDVNSTLACSVVAKKLGIMVAHIEAGLRSGDMKMPEEINRLVTDSISDHLFVTEESGMDNLRREGHSERKINFVGHVMIDNLHHQLAVLKSRDSTNLKTEKIKQSVARYGVVTLHRPSNVDSPETLRSITNGLNVVSERIPLFFPVHPRTLSNLKKHNIEIRASIHLMSPLSYMEFLNLWKDAEVVITDSGGLQEETTALGVPCVTVRENTERPVTLTHGTNVLAGTSASEISRLVFQKLDAPDLHKQYQTPPLWDGKASERIVSSLIRNLIEVE